MGDFSRSTFDRLKHYVGVRLQQGVPLVDADWNELEDIRRYEVQAFLKWFVGDGVPAGNDGFRIQALAGGGVNTIRLTPSATGPGRSSVTVNVATSTAAAALGFTNANRQASRSSAPARLTGDATQPFALTNGMTLVVNVEGSAPETVTFTTANVPNLGAASAADVVAAVNAVMTRVVASVGTGDDFVIVGGDGSPEGAGRCLVDGRDAVHEGRLAYASQPLYANTALATEWGVPVVATLAPPGTGSRTDLVYLDLWDREVTAVEDDSLVNPAIGVESCVRIRREWTVRVRVGNLQVPVSGDADHVSGHSYLPLARMTRSAGTGAVLADALADVRARNLLVPPSTLVEDVLGTNPLAYRRGESRPVISLREAINALLAGQLPATPDLPVSPGAGLDTLGRASLVDATGALVAIWHSPRVANTNQVVAARLDPVRPNLGFTAVPAITSGTVHVEPAAVALPNGDLVVAYQNGLQDATGTDVVMKRAPLAGLGAATEQPVATTTGVADQFVRVALAGDQVLFLTHQGGAVKQWFYRRYRHTDNTFLDAGLVALSAGSLTPRDLHAASAGGVVWVAYADGTRLQLLRFNPVPTTPNPSDPPVIDLQANFTAAGTLDVFVLAISATEAMVFYDDGAGLSVATCSGGTWATVRLPDTDASDGAPAAARDADGTVYLVSTRPIPDAGTDLMLRRRNATSGQWGPPQRLAPHPSTDLRPHPILVPNLGLWVLWTSNRTGDFDVYAKRVITAI